MSALLSKAQKRSLRSTSGRGITVSDARQLPGSRDNKKRLKNAVVTPNVRDTRHVLQKTGCRKTVMPGNENPRHHEEQKLTHKEHKPYSEFKATGLEAGTLRKKDAVQIVRAKPNRHGDRASKRLNTIKPGTKKHERLMALKAAKAARKEAKKKGD